LFVAQGDFNGNGQLDAGDIDQLTLAIIQQSDDPRFNYGGDELDFDDYRFWVEAVRGTSYGDANLDGVFNSGDLVAVFVAGEYEDEQIGNSGWADGDWNGDEEFNSSDFVWVFQSGSYSAASTSSALVAARPVPESSSLTLALGIIATITVRLGRRRGKASHIAYQNYSGR
jgi:hypothetical protein